MLAIAMMKWKVSNYGRNQVSNMVSRVILGIEVSDGRDSPTFMSLSEAPVSDASAGSVSPLLHHLGTRINHDSTLTGF
jgi:hypothetical protein